MSDRPEASLSDRDLALGPGAPSTRSSKSGLGQLCWIYTAIQNRGGNIKLLKTPDRFKRLLKITRLDTIFQSFESEADAIAAMEPCRPALSA